MRKIPVGATIAHAYRFAFVDFFKILSVIWLPWAIISVVSFFMMHQVVAFLSAMENHNLASLQGFLVWILPIYLGAIILMFMQVVGITQLALGMRSGSPYYYFSLGKTLWRLIGAALLTFLIMIAAYFAIIFGGIILIALTRLLPKDLAIISGFGAFAFMLAVICAYFYAIIRLTFLLTPVVAAEGIFGLKRAWSLGKGNFWRMFAVLLAIFVPVLALELIFLFGPFGPGFPATLPAHATAEQLQAFQAAIHSWNEHFMKKMLANWYITYPLFGVITIIFYGAACGAQCSAYLTLTETNTTTRALGFGKES